MFTGIILTSGKLVKIQPQGEDFRLKIVTTKLPMATVELGDSIAVDGVCLTVIKMGENYFWADVSNETIKKTTLKSKHIGAVVNLELALTPSTRLGGHIVSGHIDGVGKVVEKNQVGRCYCYKLKVQASLAKYIVAKGSICINGVGLTVNHIDGTLFDVNIVPHTLQKTTLGNLAVDTEVNIEVDLLAKYIERLIQAQSIENLTT